jgi:tripartite-type tricarboxylate transporter receptor subunit TctC
MPCLLAAFQAPASAQEYPTKSVRVIAGSAGSNVDVIARMVAEKLSQGLGVPFIIDNRPNPAISGGLLARAAPDGYTLMANASNVWIVPLLQNVPYDPLKDFAAVSLTSQAPNVLLVHSSVPVKTVRGLIALAKAKPGQLNYSSGGSGGSPHLAAELFKSMAGVDIVRIPYKGGGAAVTAVLTGEVAVTFAAAGAAMPHLHSSRVRPLAVTSAQPSPLFPGLPTVESAGLRGYEAGSTNAFLAPAGTPPAIIKLLNTELRKALQSADMRERFTKAGVEAVSSSPQQLTALIKAQMSSMGKVIKEAGIRIE